MYEDTCFQDSTKEVQLNSITREHSSLEIKIEKLNGEEIEKLLESHGLIK